jgi:hypothetical protein
MPNGTYGGVRGEGNPPLLDSLQSKGRCINLNKSVSESKNEKKETIVQTAPITELYPTLKRNTGKCW